MAEMEQTLNLKPPPGAFTSFDLAVRVKAKPATIRSRLNADVKSGKLKCGEFLSANGHYTKYFWVAPCKRR